MKKVFFSVLLCLAIILFVFFVNFSPVLAGETNKQADQCGHTPLYQLKYTADAKQYDYVNAKAPKGGTLRVSRVGTFDSLNFLRYPGTTIGSRHQIPLHMSTYLFDSFLVKSADEPASYYCLAATKLDVSADLSTVRFSLNPKARWHDGRAMTVDDVLFTFETLKKQGVPYYRQVLRTISARKGRDGEVIYQNTRLHDRNFVHIVGTLPIHPKHFWASEGKLTKKSMILPLGSGPYRITSAQAGKFAHLKRVKTYWARDHFTRQGRFNFDQIEIDYFRDNRSSLEAFKLGHYDIRLEREAVAWANEYEGEKFSTGRYQKLDLPASNAGDLFFLAFNQRRPLFKNRQVRKALALLYDFSSANKVLFHNLYQPVASVYGDSALAAKGFATREEAEFLKPFMKDLPEGILKTAGPQWQMTAQSWREKMRLAARLLDEAGVVVKNQRRINPETGKPLVLTVSYLEASHQRILLHFQRTLKQVGIDLELPKLEPMAARRKAMDHDFDMIVLKWSPQLYAGQTEFLLWGSRLADMKGTYAFAGVKDPALDQAIAVMRRATDQKTLQLGAKLFDRIFRWQSYAIPLWRRQKNWVAMRQGIQRPEKDPHVEFSIIDRLWAAPAQQSHYQK